MGVTGSGKTSVSMVCLVMVTRNSPGRLQFINLASDSNLRVGTGSGPCTAKVQLANKFILDGRIVTLIDTPGFGDTALGDLNTLGMIANYLANR